MPDARIVWVYSNGQSLNNVNSYYWSGLKVKEALPRKSQRQNPPAAPSNLNSEGAVDMGQRVERYLSYTSIASALGIPEMDNIIDVSIADYRDPSRRACDGCQKRVKISGLAILGLCGHIACFECLQKPDRSDKCIVSWCSASAAANTIHVATNLARGKPKAVTWEGSKLDAIIDLIRGSKHGRRIGEDRQVLIFVQNEQIGHSVQDALTRAGVTYYSALDKKRGPKTWLRNDKVDAVNRFKGEELYKQNKNARNKTVEENKAWRKCLVLKMFDESAAGV